VAGSKAYGIWSLGCFQGEKIHCGKVYWASKRKTLILHACKCYLEGLRRLVRLRPFERKTWRGVLLQSMPPADGDLTDAIRTSRGRHPAPSTRASLGLGPVANSSSAGLPARVDEHCKRINAGGRVARRAVMQRPTRTGGRLAYGAWLVQEQRNGRW
jgi:hypothetical protein